MIRCEQQEFMTKKYRDRYPRYHVFFKENHFCSLPMGWPDRHKKCSYTWKCCQTVTVTPKPGSMTFFWAMQSESNGPSAKTHLKQITSDWCCTGNFCFWEGKSLRNKIRGCWRLFSAMVLFSTGGFCVLFSTGVLKTATRKMLFITKVLFSTQKKGRQGVKKLPNFKINLVPILKHPSGASNLWERQSF